MRTYNIAVLPGDGIGKEVTKQACLVLDAVASRFDFLVNYTNALIGGCAIDATGEALPEDTLNICKASDAVLLGAVGGTKWDTGSVRPEHGLLAIRKNLQLYANLRPAIVHRELVDASPLKSEILKEGLDILIVRELTGGLYFGKRERNSEYAYDTMSYTKDEIVRVAKVAFEAAMKRNKRVCSVDKANVLDTSKLWRQVIIEVSKEYEQVELSHMYVDNAAMQLVLNPSQFDVIVTENLFGDILSDEASQITGSIGMLPSASLGSTALGLYEPVHGSAPDIEGKGIANPIAAILSVALMLRYSLAQQDAARCIEDAVTQTLKQKIMTIDIANGKKCSSTQEVGKSIVDIIKDNKCL